MLQVQSMQALAGCLGWRLKGAGSVSQDQQLTLRYGSLFRFTLSDIGQDTQCLEGNLELAPTGIVQQQWS